MLGLCASLIISGILSANVLQIIRAVRVDGMAVDPEEVQLIILDPEEPADAFQEGIHPVSDFFDDLIESGRLVLNEEDLIGHIEDDTPSATLDEEFPDIDDGPLRDAEVDLEDGLEIISEDFEDEE